MLSSLQNSLPYPLPDNEQDRLKALYAYNILDSAPEASFDRIAGMAARLFDAPIASISLVDADRQWFKACCGLDVQQTSRDLSFCAHAMLGSSPMVVCDATKDRRFRNYANVTGEPHIRFYVGAPLLASNGLPLGSLCVIDKIARQQPSPEQLQNLADLAFLVAQQIEFRFVTAAKQLSEKRYQDQLERAKQTAENANRAKSDFLARMSHEIRTPMNLILGMNALLLESPLNEKNREYVEISHRNVKRLLRLINGILDLSKVESKELTFQSVPFALDELLKECATTISPAVERKGLKFQISIQPGVWQYWTGDPERLQQVLLNLVGNSIKFTKHGTISVSVSHEFGLQGETGLRFEVADTGCGVPKDKAALIFEAFQQAEESTDRSYEGSGLGLTIARTLVQRMSGKIWLEERTEPGSKFVFTAFLAPATAKAVQTLKNPEPIQSSSCLPERLRILLVDDNPENVILVKAYLAAHPVTVDVAVNGIEAIEKHQKGNFDIILMDIQMPVMDGHTATRQIRRWEKAQGLTRIPILALTAHAFNGAAAESIDAGCDVHLSKPIEKHRLLEAIASFAHLPKTEKQCAPQPGKPALPVPTVCTVESLEIKQRTRGSLIPSHASPLF